MMYLKRTHFSCRIKIPKKKIYFLNEKMEKSRIVLVAPFHIAALYSKTLFAN